MLKQHFEMVTKIHKIKEITTRNGKFMYTFSIPITKMVGDEQHTQWLNCTVLLKERDPRLVTHTGEFHFSGSLVLKEAWGTYPEGLSFLGFEISPVLGDVYRVRKPQSKEQKPHSTSNNMNDPSSNQVRQHERVEEAQANKDPLFAEMSEEIPF